MVRSIPEIGILAEHMAMEYSLIQKGKFTMAHGGMTRLTAMELTLTATVPNMKATGIKIYNMVLELRVGQMDQNLLGCIWKAEKMVSENTYGLMELAMKGNGKKMKSLDMAIINGLMAENISVIGRVI
jgi:hypothetical protein